MTDFVFLNAAGTVNVTLRTDLVTLGNAPAGNLTVCQKIITADPNTIFVNIARNKTDVATLKAFAVTNALVCFAIPISGKGAVTVGVNFNAPTSPATVVNSATQITVNWTKTPGASGYIVERATNSTFTTGLVAFTVGDVATKAVTGLTTATAYWFRVRATSIGLQSANSTTVTATTS